MAQAAHWEDVYSRRTREETSWYEPHLQRSLALIEKAGLSRDAAILDVGGGDSTLADDLLARGYKRLTLLDLSRAALERTRSRLGAAAGELTWIEGDVTRAALPAGRFDLWHDRAMFHFLTDSDDRKRYVRQLLSACKPHAYLVISTFGPQGPTRCSGLPIQRFSAPELSQTLGDAFRLLESSTAMHMTPSGAEQQFLSCLFQLT